jgi:hypothetical protein
MMNYDNAPYKIETNTVEIILNQKFNITLGVSKQLTPGKKSHYGTGLTPFHKPRLQHG